MINCTAFSYIKSLQHQKAKMYSQLFIVVLITVFTLSHELDVTFFLLEEQSSGTLVGNIMNKSSLTSSIQGEDIQNLRYNFLDQQSHMRTIFSINDRTSNIFTTVVIDRETVCEFSSICMLEFDISVQSIETQFFEIITVRINVGDKNDNSPFFLKSKVTLQIRESAEVGSTFGIDSAMDPDTGINSIQDYELLPKTGTFNLTKTRNIDGTFTIKIVVNADLDRESQDQYQVTVLAKDGGNPPKEGMAVIDIEITDANDNPPVFGKQTYQINVKEDVSVNSVLLEVSATDRDIGLNGDLFYRFSSHLSAQGIFVINDTTGEISLVRSLVYELGLAYRLVVEASDKSEEPLVVQAEVIINILDSGNNPPKVKINLLTPGNVQVVDISESAPSGKLVAHIDVEDSDTGDNGIVDCKTTDPLFGLQTLSSERGFMVIVSGVLDRENKDIHNVTTVCRDRGNPPLSSSASLFIHVTDSNDEIPTFVNEHYTAHVTENSLPGKKLLGVSAYDRDLDMNAQITYHIHRDAESKVLIDSESGKIIANIVFDRELTPTVEFRVLAVDFGNPPLTGTTTVTIYVDDINDHSPVFNKSNLEFGIYENKKANTIAGRLSATDEDKGENSTIKFYLSPDTSSNFPFDVLPDGTIKTNRELDREKQSRYDFIVVARDQGPLPLSTSTMVTVSVLDMNDNIPEFIWPNNTHNALFISKVIPNLPIAQVRAYDVDVNQVLTYSIQGGNEDNVFGINSRSGDLFIKEEYHTSEDKVFILTVAVKDDGDSPEMASYRLKVIIAQNNDTTLRVPAEVSQKYIIISAVVVTVTLLISIGLIAVICVVRRVDKQKQNQYGANQIELEIRQIYDKTKVSDNHLESGKKGKKGVSFSLDNDEKQIPLSKLSGSTKFSKEKKSSNQVPSKLPPFGNVSGPQNSQRQILQFHQELPHNKSNLQNQCHYDDSPSESSGEITASDSGRGGSEDETTHNITLQDEVHSLDIPIPPPRAHFGPRDTQPQFVRLNGNRTSSFMERNINYNRHSQSEKNFLSGCMDGNQNTGSESFIPSYV